VSLDDGDETLHFKRPSKQAFVRVDGGDCHSTSEVVCRIRNFKHVAKLGESLRKYIEAGDDRVVFSSTGYDDSQKKAVFAIGCYLADVIRDKHILLMTSGKDGEILKFFEASEVSSLDPNDLKPLSKARVYGFGSNLSIMDIDEMLAVGSQRDQVLDEVIAAVKSYDIVLWNTPSINIMRQNLHFFHRLLYSFKIITLIVARNTLTTTDVEDIKEFYESHGISLKGAIFSPLSPENKDKK